MPSYHEPWTHSHAQPRRLCPDFSALSRVAEKLCEGRGSAMLSHFPVVFGKRRPQHNGCLNIQTSLTSFCLEYIFDTTPCCWREYQDRILWFWGLPEVGGLLWAVSPPRVCFCLKGCLLSDAAASPSVVPCHLSHCCRLRPSSQRPLPTLS